jgi:FKBP-type peptidyl-prolyl cis-trans isomerase 2
MSKATNGNTVTLHYVGTLENGTEFDNSKTRGEALTFQLGEGQVVTGFNDGVLGMETGETKTFNIPCETAYGSRNDQAVQAVPKSAFPEGFEFNTGGLVEGTGPDGQPFRARILAIKDEEIALDFNHPLAGKDLNFTVELLEVK